MASTLERWIGAVIAPEVRVAGTIASPGEVAPTRAYLERFPPALVVAFGRTPGGAVSPAPLLERVRRVCAELGAAAPIAACDLEQGAGLHFPDATRLPPAAALAQAASSGGAREALDWIVAAGELTGREARERGVELVLAPVADVNDETSNPIIAARSFGDDPARVAERALAFSIGVRSSGAGACAKHFPGHGHTRSDSHVELPRVERDLATLRRVELEPFRRLIEHGLDAVMIAHLDVPALSGEPGLPSTLSPRVVSALLRGELGFRGAALSDAMNMAALSGVAERYSRALAAGCDALLCPHDPFAAANELLEAARSGRLDLARLEEAARRVEELRERLRGTPQVPSALGDGRLAQRLADRALLWIRKPAAPARGRAARLLDPLAPAETPELRAALEPLGHEIGRLDLALDVLPVVCEARAGRGHYGPTEAELRALAGAVERHPGTLLVLWMGTPQSLPRELRSESGPPLLVAFAPTPPMFDAVSRALRSLTRLG
jgi:beta-glucosidase-like glycosyl hydrolase